MESFLWLLILIEEVEGLGLEVKFNLYCIEWNIGNLIIFKLDY